MPVYKNEDRNTWYTTFYYTDWQGNRKKKKKEGFNLKREAQEFEKEFVKQVSCSCDMSFNSLLDLYLADCKTRLKETTYYTKSHILNTQIRPVFADMVVNDIKPTTIRTWQNNLLNSPSEYTQTYLRQMNTQLSSVFTFAKKYYNLIQNPINVCGAIGKSASGKIDFWTLDEFKTFIDKIEKPSHCLVFNILFWTGIRRGELLALTYEDFDLDNMTLRINKTFTKLDKKEIITEPKTPKSNRIILLPKHLCDMVQEYKSKLYEYNPEDRIFTFSVKVLYDALKRGYEKVNIKPIRLHDLRHPYVKLKLKNNSNFFKPSALIH